MFGFEMIGSNFDDGYPEACMRALQKGFLREQDYENLKSCNSFDEFKLILDETDYGKYIQMPDGKIEVNQLKRRMQAKLRDEIEYIMGNASSGLQAFLQQMMHQYQIENIISYISGMNN